MKVIVNRPAPVVAPPTTYDLTGLTLAQMQFLYHSIGDEPSGPVEKKYGLPKSTGYEIFDALFKADFPR